MGEQFIQNLNARPMPNKVGMHCKEKQPTFLISTIKFSHKDFSYTRWWRVGSQTSKTVHRPIRCIIAYPFNRQFNDTRSLAFFKNFIGIIIGHQRTVIDQTHFTSYAHGVRTKIPGWGSNTYRTYPSNFFELVCCTELQVSLILRCQRTV